MQMYRKIMYKKHILNKLDKNQEIINFRDQVLQCIYRYLCLLIISLLLKVDLKNHDKDISGIVSIHLFQLPFTTIAMDWFQSSS